MKIRTGFRLPTILNEFLDKVASEKGLSKNALVIEALWQYMNSQNNMKK